MLHLLITRPQDSSDELALRLTELGYRCSTEPLIDIMATSAPCPALDNVQAIMITSGNAISQLAKIDASALFAYPCFCVGPKTAAKARQLGFIQVYHTLGDGLELASLIQSALSDKSRAILHISAEDYDSKACDSLQQNGFRILSWAIYKAEAARMLTATTQHDFLENKIDAVLLFSARSADTFRKLMSEHGLSGTCHSVTAIGLSQNISDVVKDMPWRRQLTTTTPTEEDVILCLQQNLPAHAMTKFNESHDPSQAENDNDTMNIPQNRKAGWKLHLLTFCIALICGMAATGYLISHYDLLQNTSLISSRAISPPNMAVTNNSKDTPATISVAPIVSVAPREDKAALVAQPETIEAGKIPSDTSITEKDDALRRQGQDIARLQNDVVALSSALAAVQADVKHTQDLENRIQKTSQNAIGTSVDFMRLSSAAISGRAFSRELSVFRARVTDNAIVQQRLSDLEPIAAQAIPSLPALREQFIHLEPDLIRAGDMAAAQTWWQRLTAWLGNLIVVRRAHSDGKADGFGKIETLLAQNDIAAVDQALAVMPTDEQTILQPWRVKLRMRQQIDAAMTFIADQLGGRADILAPGTQTPVAAPELQPTPAP